MIRHHIPTSLGRSSLMTLNVANNICWKAAPDLGLGVDPLIPQLGRHAGRWPLHHERPGGHRLPGLAIMF
jgi:hypothetical protein